MRRFGRRPLCLTRIHAAELMPRGCTLAQIGPVVLGDGPADGIDAGHAMLPDGTRTRLWCRRNGMGFAVSLLARGAHP